MYIIGHSDLRLPTSDFRLPNNIHTMNKNYLILIFILIGGTVSYSQQIDSLINVKEAERIEKILSADNMQGRKVFSPGIDRAADFIATEFKKAGLQTLQGSPFYLQS